MIDITEILCAVIALIFSIIGIFILPLLKEKLSCARLDYVRKWVNIAVYACEQLIGNGNGEEKKEIVTGFLEKHGFTLDADKLDALIESEVAKMKGGKES